MESNVGPEILQPGIVGKRNWLVHVKQFPQECILINTALGVICN